MRARGRGVEALVVVSVLGWPGFWRRRLCQATTRSTKGEVAVTPVEKLDDLADPAVQVSGTGVGAVAPVGESVAPLTKAQAIARVKQILRIARGCPCHPAPAPRTGRALGKPTTVPWVP